MINKIKQHFRVNKEDIAKVLENQQLLHKRINEELAAAQISSLLSSCQYLPFSKASLNFTSLAVLLNDIVINNRKFIVEFGAGISTLLMPLLIKKNKLENVHILSVENDAGWMQVVGNLLASEGLSEYVTLLHAPLSNNTISLDNNQWYDLPALTKTLDQAGRKVDCVLVDGPAAWYNEVYRSRYPALPVLEKYLNEKCSVFLDDTDRKGEKEIVALWQKFGLTRVDFSHCFTGFFKGEFFNVSLP